MNRWLRKKFKNWLNAYDEICVVDSPVRSGPAVDVDGLTFNVMKANGGVIVQTRTYDRITDRHNYSTYLIHDEESIVERVGQIVALEILKS